MDNKNKRNLVAVNSATKKLIDDIALIIAHTNINQFNISNEKVVEVAVKQLAKRLKHLETISKHEKNTIKNVTTIDNLEIKAKKTHNIKNKNTNTKTSTPITEINEVVSNDNRFYQDIQSHSQDEPSGNNMKEELADYLDNFDV